MIRSRDMAKIYLCQSWVSQARKAVTGRLVSILTLHISAMGFLFKKYKSKFRYALKPFFAMLHEKEKAMTNDEWQTYVRKTYERIMDNPVDFLGTDLPEKDLQRDILDEIFKEFQKDLKIKGKSSASFSLHRSK